MFKRDRTVELCNSLLNISEAGEFVCSRTNCNFLHDVKKYLEIKQKDIGNVIFCICNVHIIACFHDIKIVPVQFNFVLFT